MWRQEEYRDVMHKMQYGAQIKKIETLRLNEKILKRGTKKKRLKRGAHLRNIENVESKIRRLKRVSSKKLKTCSRKED